MQVIAGIVSVILVIVILGTIGFLGYHTIDNLVNDRGDFGECFSQAWNQYREFIGGIFGAKAEQKHEFEFKIQIK